MIKRDYYLILGVSPKASNEGIKDAFRRLVKKYHPDVAGPMSRWEFQEIIEAYDVLSDPSRRRSYDQGIAHGEGKEFKEPDTFMTGSYRYSSPLVPEPASFLRSFHSVSQSIEALSDHIFRSFADMVIPRARLPESLTMELILTPEEAFSGGRVPISIPVPYPCPECKGSVTGFTDECPHCSGNGMVEEEEQIVLRIPPGIRSGTVFEMPMAGLGIHNYYLRVIISIGTAA